MVGRKNIFCGGKLLQKKKEKGVAPAPALQWPTTQGIRKPYLLAYCKEYMQLLYQVRIR
jgi:hypothetical protein